jgi:hypothetical protein
MTCAFDGNKSLMDMPLATLLVTVNRKKVDFAKEHSLLGLGSRQYKNKGSNVYSEALKHATQNEKAILRKPCPSMQEQEEYQAHLDAVNEAAKSVATKLLTALRSMHVRKFNKAWHVNTLDKLTVTSIYNFFQKK